MKYLNELTTYKSA